MSDLEKRFERLRALSGFWLAPLFFLLVWFSNFESLADKPAAHHLAAVMAAVVTLWVTEAIPMPLTALLGATACVVFQVGSAKGVFAPFADQLMFLFIGSFMLARAIELHGLDRRLALSVLTLKAVGGSPSRVLFAFGATTAFISAWISNTATTAMMFAIGLSILKVLQENGTHTTAGSRASRLDPRYATGLMLMTSFSASIGGLATPIGTPPNAIGLGLIRQQGGNQLAEPDTFIAQVVVAWVQAGGVGPALGEGGVDRVQHRVQPLGQVFAIGQAKRNACLLDLGLGARQALAHGGRGHQKS